MGPARFRTAVIPFLLSTLPAIPAAVPWAAQAGEIAVTTVADTNDGSCDEHCSLREALSEAADGDVVAVPAGTYTLTLGRATGQRIVTQAHDASWDCVALGLESKPGDVVFTGVVGKRLPAFDVDGRPLPGDGQP